MAHKFIVCLLPLEYKLLDGGSFFCSLLGPQHPHRESGNEVNEELNE